jgi:aminoglycoside phosphotransferase (APT) family kinase protein
MPEQDNLSSRETVRAVLEVIAPGYTDFRIQPLAGSFSNCTNLVAVEFAGEVKRQIVVRRYNEANGNCEAKARREYEALRLLRDTGVPAPAPLYLDAEGKLLGSPGIVTALVAGKMIEAVTEPKNWGKRAEVLAQMLARIHKVNYAEADQTLLMDANVNAAWFLKRGSVPEYMRGHPDGVMVWETVHDGLPSRQVDKSVLIHVDYWSGNVLWEGDEVSAVVDWEEAGYGEAGIDVAYCLMEFYLLGLDNAADSFLKVYEKEMGHATANLGLWELAAAARPMTDQAGWFTRPGMAERFRAFITRAREMVTG